MKLFKYNKKEKVFLIVALVIIILLIITSVASGFIFKNLEKKQNTNIHTGSTKGSVSSTESIDSEDKGDKVSDIVSDDKTKYDDWDISMCAEVIESLDWSGYLRPDHTDEDKYSLKISGNKWTVNVDGEKAHEYTVRFINLTESVSVWPIYTITADISSPDYTGTAVIEFKIIDTSNRYVLDCEKLICPGFKADM